MYCLAGKQHLWAQHLANTIELKIILGGVVFAYQEPELDQVDAAIEKEMNPFLKLTLQGFSPEKVYTPKELQKIINEYLKVDL
jgi:hypothetical protein